MKTRLLVSFSTAIVILLVCILSSFANYTADGFYFDPNAKIKGSDIVVIKVYTYIGIKSGKVERASINARRDTLSKDAQAYLLTQKYTESLRNSNGFGIKVFVDIYKDMIGVPLPTPTPTPKPIPVKKK